MNINTQGKLLLFFLIFAFFYYTFWVLVTVITIFLKKALFRWFSLDAKVLSQKKLRLFDSNAFYCFGCHFNNYFCWTRAYLL